MGRRVRGKLACTVLSGGCDKKQLDRQDISVENCCPSYQGYSRPKLRQK